MSTAPPITCVSEIVLNVADLPRTRDFYQNVMGFELHSEVSLESEVADPDGDPTISFLIISALDTPLGRDAHPQLLALIDYRRHIFAKARVKGLDPARSALNHLAFEIPPTSFDIHVERLAELGIPLQFSDFPAMGAKAMFFRDPEGNTLELICHSGRPD